jgi:uncharacterized protein involved in exopolysaccharide biosynthesis
MKRGASVVKSPPKEAALVVEPRVLRLWEPALFWGALICGPVIVGAAMAYGASLLLEPLYAARAEVVLHLSENGEAANRALGTQAALLRSNAVLEPVTQKFPLTVETLDEHLEIEFPLNGAVMTLQYADPVPNVATNILQEILSQYSIVSKSLNVGEATAYELIAPPYVLDEPVSPRPLQAAALGAAIGLTFAVAAAALLQRRKTLQ